MYTNDPDTIRVGASPLDCDGPDCGGAVGELDGAPDWIGMMLHTGLRAAEAGGGDSAGLGGESTPEELATIALDRVWSAITRRADVYQVEALLQAADLALEQVDPDPATIRRYQRLAETAEALRAIRGGE